MAHQIWASFHHCSLRNLPSPQVCSHPICRLWSACVFPIKWNKLKLICVQWCLILKKKSILQNLKGKPIEKLNGFPGYMYNTVHWLFNLQLKIIKHWLILISRRNCTFLHELVLFLLIARSPKFFVFQQNSQVHYYKIQFSLSPHIDDICVITITWNSPLSQEHFGPLLHSWLLSCLSHQFFLSIDRNQSS